MSVKPGRDGRSFEDFEIGDDPRHPRGRPARRRAVPDFPSVRIELGGQRDPSGLR